MRARHPPNGSFTLVWIVAICAATVTSPADEDVGSREQHWVRDADGPVVSLGKPGTWDDTHIFAPCVAFENGVYSLWYCGSRGDVQARVFQMGLATSTDGVHFVDRPDPIYAFGDDRHSILTPAVLRDTSGRVLREHGALRMWFSAADLTQPNAPHTLHETRSQHGVHWSAPSPPELEDVYAPTILKEDGAYRMWYTDVSADPWIIRHAQSKDGVAWEVTNQPCIAIDQAWERNRLFYPTVLKAGSKYLMWYGSYWAAHEQTTALGFAVSNDGLAWRKNPNNPVFTPDPNRPWESHYTTSQSVLPLDDDSFRIWYASRKAPPFANKYFAICTARWVGIR